MKKNKVVSRDEWLDARKKHLKREKEFDRLRDQLSVERRQLPWELIPENYQFEAAEGPTTLADSFGKKSQLLVYHFMFHPDWTEGCPSCSFWTDSFDGIMPHLNARDVSVVLVSRAPIDKIEAFRRRMGWDVRWLSSFGNAFNQDFGVSFTPDQIASGNTTYNYKTPGFDGPEAPGVSVFIKDTEGEIFHTYSTYGRGLDKLNLAYHYLDIMPRGRNEADLPYPQAWVRHHDKYDAE